MCSSDLRRPLENPLATGRISAWAMELQGFGLKFEHTDNIKSQALADFTAEWTEMAFDDSQVQEINCSTFQLEKVVKPTRS